MNASDDMTSPTWIERRSSTVRHIDDVRTDFEIDHARVIHSGSFRRLQGKTQILAIGDGDFYRTRLTHSLEVAQVAEGVLQRLRSVPAPDLPIGLLEQSALFGSVALAHDLGHPPFGHGGETALNYCMRHDGGFEGNAQTLRILAVLENFSRSHGADLTRRTMLGVLKYPVPWSFVRNPGIEPGLDERTTMIVSLDRAACVPPKAFYDEDQDTVDWMLRPFEREDRDMFVRSEARPGRHGKAMYKSFDCSIMDVSDDIAYGVHDLEDAVTLELIDEDRFRAAFSAELCGALISALADRPLEGGGRTYDAFVKALFGTDFDRKKAVGRLVHHLLRNIVIERRPEFASPLLAYRVTLAKEARRLLDGLKTLVANEVIQHPRVQHLEFKGQRMVVSVFEAFIADPVRLLPRSVLAAYESSRGGARAICDHVASMTDAGLMRTYERLFSPRMGSVFDRH